MKDPTAVMCHNIAKYDREHPASKMALQGSMYSDHISEFFQEYVKFPKAFYTECGNLTDSGIREAARLLLKNCVFDSPEDMREQAMKDYDIILPESIFE